MSHTMMLKDRSALHANDRSEYRIYLALTFPLFLVAAILGRLPTKRRAGSVEARRRSVFHEAMDTAHSAIPWVFMTRG